LYQNNSSGVWYTLGYYFTGDGLADIGASFLSARQYRPDGSYWDLKALNVISCAVYSVSPATTGADKTVGISFGGSVTLNPGDYIIIGLYITNRGNANFNQANDYSFNSKDTGYNYWTRTPVFYNTSRTGGVTWGAAPYPWSQ